MSIQVIKSLFIALVTTLAFMAGAYAHCGDCGEGEAKDHKHNDARLACMKKCAETAKAEVDVCKKGCLEHHKDAKKNQMKGKVKVNVKGSGKGQLKTKKTDENSNKSKGSLIKKSEDK